MRKVLNGIRNLKRISKSFMIIVLNIILVTNSSVSVAKSVKNTTYYPTTRDEFYTILFDEAAQDPNENIKIIVKGNLAAKLEKEFDKFYANLDFKGLDVLTEKSYLNKYKNRQAFSFNDIASWGYMLDYDSKKSFKTGKTNYFEVSFDDNGHGGKKKRKEYEKLMKTWLINLDLEDKSDVERVRTIVDLICDKIEYHDTGVYVGPYTALDGVGVCANYTQLTSSLLDAIGIDAFDEEGYIDPSKKDLHAWNVVKIHNRWYDLDTTWIDGGDSDCFLKGKNSEVFKYRNKSKNISSDIIVKQYKLSNTDCVDDGYKSLLRAWLIGISDSNVTTKVGKNIKIKKDRLTKVTSSNTKIAEIKNGKIIAKKKGRVTITRSDGVYKSQYYVLIK